MAGGLPDVTLTCLGNGPPVHLAGLTGKPTVVNVWGSWCMPCQTEEKYLSSAYDATARQGPIPRHRHRRTTPTARSTSTLTSTPPVRFPSVFDPDKKVLLGLHSRVRRRRAFLDRAGRIVHVTRVPVHEHRGSSRADIATYLHVPT